MMAGPGAHPLPARPATLYEKLARRIGADGPMPVADFMQACLADPDFGYYRARDPIGAAGDFVTAPEVSQMFGELLGLWCAETWTLMGRPPRFNLVELGPGRGTLMADALRAARLVPDFLAAARLHLVEVNPALKEKQAEALRPSGLVPAWHAELAAVPLAPTVLLANEFLDALPVRQFVRAGRRWVERCVGLDADGQFGFTLAAAPLDDDAAIPAPLRKAAAEGAVAEVRPAADALAARLGDRARAHALAALVIDYGHIRSAAGDTLQAVRAHAHADPLAEPGAADLTAHVDFEALAGAARKHGLRVHGPMPQGAFLLALGLRERFDRLLSANPAHGRAIALGARRLVGPDQMGELFKVVALTGKGLVPPPFGRPRGRAS